MTILTPMDQLKEQERIHKNNLLDLNEYPLRSDKRGKYLRAFYSYKTKYIKKNFIILGGLKLVNVSVV